MSTDKIAPPLRNDVLALLMLAGLAVLVFAFLDLVAPNPLSRIVDSETGVDTNKQRIASSVIFSTVDSINDEIYSSRADDTSKLDGTGGLQASKGNIWIEGVTTPTTFYIPAVPLISKMSNPYVDISGTVEEYTVIYSESYLNMTAVYNSKTDKIEITDRVTPLTEESQG